MLKSGIDREAAVAMNDRRLEPLLRADDAEAERELARLIVEEARPVVAGIVSRYTRSGTLMTAEDADDLVATIDLRLVQKLRAVRGDAGEAIEHLRNYVATLTYNAVNDFLRKRYPERARLKKRVRYMLTNDDRLAMWMTDRGPACGLRAWAGREDPLEPLPPLRAAMKEDDRDALHEIFRAVGRPVLVDALVDILDGSSISGDPAPESDASHFAAPATPVDQQFEAVEFAKTLWKEILQLRAPQRKALLLNLRYGGEFDFVSVLVLSGIARFGEIAAALEISEPELAKLWNELPLDDLRIAEMLQLTRQQVINLRKAARHRLARRLPR